MLLSAAIFISQKLLRLFSLHSKYIRGSFRIKSSILLSQDIESMTNEIHKAGTNDGWHGVIEEGGHFPPAKGRYHPYIGWISLPSVVVTWASRQRTVLSLRTSRLPGLACEGSCRVHRRLHSRTVSLRRKRIPRMAVSRVQWRLSKCNSPKAVWQQIFEWKIVQSWQRLQGQIQCPCLMGQQNGNNCQQCRIYSRCEGHRFS